MKKYHLLSAARLMGIIIVLALAATCLACSFHGEGEIKKEVKLQIGTSNFSGTWKLTIAGKESDNLVLKQQGKSVSGYRVTDENSRQTFSGEVDKDILKGKFILKNPDSEWKFEATIATDGKSFDGHEYYSNPPYKVLGEKVGTGSTQESNSKDSAQQDSTQQGSTQQESNQKESTQQDSNPQDGNQIKSGMTQEIVFSNDVLQQSMEAIDSYRRKIRTVSTDVKTGIPKEAYNEFAYIRNPYSEHMILDFVTSGSYVEDMIIDGIFWSRPEKGGKWEKYLPGSWSRELPLSFRYDLNIQYYPINYGKLKFQPVGTEQVNGINCIKYTVSGSYEDEFSFRNSPEKYPIKLFASGTIWIADDPVIKKALIRQCITVDTDVESALKDAQGKPVHAISKDVIEDDVMNVNSTVIQPPTD